MSTYKPFGWETLEIRYGGLRARLETLHARIVGYLDQTDETIDSLPELEVEAQELYPGQGLSMMLCVRPALHFVKRTRTVCAATIRAHLVRHSVEQQMSRGGSTSMRSESRSGQNLLAFMSVLICTVLACRCITFACSGRTGSTAADLLAESPLLFCQPLTSDFLCVFMGRNTMLELFAAMLQGPVSAPSSTSMTSSS